MFLACIHATPREVLATLVCGGELLLFDLHHVQHPTQLSLVDEQSSYCPLVVRG